ncbi:MAG: oligosaccharide flippase family protein [Bacteroidetes bacterium]|nr:oligosaccharide flippase family protein [Bacteroidota bacterium]MBU2585304.1 oligosaccharide flippase family protein [Bacteroidota bacterium]
MSEIKKYWFPSGIYSFLQNIVLLISGFTSFVLLVRFYSKSEFGAWALYLAVTTFADVTRSGFVNNALIKFGTPANENDYRKILSASLFMHSIMTLAGITLIIILAPMLGRVWNSSEFYYLLMLYPAYAICQVPYIFMSAVEQARFNFRGQYYSNLTRNFIFIGIIAYLIIIAKSLPLYMLPIIQAISVLGAGVVIYIFTKRFIKFSKTINWDWVKKLFNFGKFALGGNVLSILFTNIDQIMLGYFFNTSYVAVYNTAMRVGNFSDIPMTSVATIVYPKSTQRLDQIGDKSLRHLYERSVGVILAFVVPGIILLTIFAEDIIHIIASQKYADALPVIYFVLIFSLFKPFIRYFSLSMDTLGRPNTHFWLVMSLLGFNIVLNLFLIPSYDLIGAAISSLLSLLLGATLCYKILQKELKVSIFRIIKYMFNFYFEGIRLIVAFNEFKVYLDGESNPEKDKV